MGARRSKESQHLVTFADQYIPNLGPFAIRGYWKNEDSPFKSSNPRLLEFKGHLVDDLSVLLPFLM